jgi:hypothetical protein
MSPAVHPYPLVPLLVVDIKAVDRGGASLKLEGHGP